MNKDTANKLMSLFDWVQKAADQAVLENDRDGTLRAYELMLQIIKLQTEHPVMTPVQRTNWPIP